MRKSAEACRPSRTLFWPFLPIGQVGRRAAWLLVAVAILALERRCRLAGLDHDRAKLAAAAALPRELGRQLHDWLAALGDRQLARGAQLGLAQSMRAAPGHAG